MYGKITEVKTSNLVYGYPSQVAYTYDALGNRISKREGNYGYGSTGVNYTWQVRDGSGNTLATYVAGGDSTAAPSTYTLYWTGTMLYGSNRLGTMNIFREIDNIGYTNPSWAGWWTYYYGGLRTRGNKLYEMTNHLGNVMVTLFDKKVGVPRSSDSSLIATYKAMPYTVNDYYPFGLPMPYRNTYNPQYRYGFNGKENDLDFRGFGVITDYGMRIYNARLGKFLSIDPLTNKYPELTPYQFASNMPIIAIDLDGEEGKIVTVYHSASTGKEFLRLENNKNTFGLFSNSITTIHKYPVQTSRGSTWVQVGPSELSFDRPVNFQTGRIDLTMQSLGKLSEKYESRGVGTVSSGAGDYGGVSYGNWQLSSNMGSPEDFLLTEGSTYKDKFGDAKPGSKQFSRIWKEIAKTDPENFEKSQHAFIKRRDYDRLVSNVKENSGIDVNSRSGVLQDVIWSTAVQHGGATNVVTKALEGKDAKKLSDAEIIKLIYNERGRKNSKGNLARFTSSSKGVQDGVEARYKSEMKEALDKLEKNN